MDKRSEVASSSVMKGVCPFQSTDSCCVSHSKSNNILTESKNKQVKITFTLKSHTRSRRELFGEENLETYDSNDKN